MSGKPSPKRPTYAISNLRAWRKHRGLTLEQLADRINMTAATLSRLERGQQAYTQPVLELLADALLCEPADLIMRLPPESTQHRIWSVLSGMTEAEQERALRVILATKDVA